MKHFWEYLAYIANVLIFLMVGMQPARCAVDVHRSHRTRICLYVDFQKWWCSVRYADW